MRAELMVILWGIVVVQTAGAGCEGDLPAVVADDLDLLVGQPADIAPGAYLFRSDLNSKPWTDFDASTEVVRLHDVKGTVRVEAGC